MAAGPAHAVLMDEGGLGDQLGITTHVHHPIFEEHIRTKALVTLSRSGTDIRPGCVIGQHTNAILGELGYSDEVIAQLHALNVVAG